MTSPHGAVTFDWADGTYTFRLALGQIRELQDKCDAGPNTIFRRILEGAWRIDDVRETLRLGLIGGGLEPPMALKLVRVYVDERPWLENVPAAAIVLSVALSGPAGDTTGKEMAPATATGTEFSSPPSTAEAPSWGSVPQTSTP